MMETIFNIILVIAIAVLWVKVSYLENEVEDLKDDLGV